MAVAEPVAAPTETVSKRAVPFRLAVSLTATCVQKNLGGSAQ